MSQKLEVYPNSDSSAIIGRAHIGYALGDGGIGLSDYAAFSHIDHASLSNYALFQSGVGETLLNSASGNLIRFRIANADKMVINSSGNVGIGTDNPTTNLHVKSTGNEGKIIIENETLALLQLVQPISTGDKTYNIELGRTDGDLTFRSTNGEKMRITEAGNVGIGTNDPKTTLHVNHDFHIAANSSSWNGTAGKGLYMRYSTNSSQDGAYIQSNDRTSGQDYPLTFEASKFFFKDGNVGIGTENPTEKLEVNGNLKINNGNLIASQNIHKMHYVFSDTNWTLKDITSFTSFNGYTITKTAGTDLFIFYSSVFTINGHGDDDFEYRIRVTSTNTIYSDTYHIESNTSSNSSGVRGVILQI